MPNELSPEEQQQQCIHCGSPAVVPDYANPLCTDCRTSFINYPVPKWVLLFAAGLGVVLIASLFNLPDNISSGIRLEKGIKEVDQHNYATAEEQLKAFSKAVPQSPEGNAYLLIASFYNGDLEQMYNAYKLIKNKQIDDEDLFNRVTGILNKADNYFPSDSLNALYEANKQNDESLRDTALAHYVKNNPDDLYAASDYASVLYNNNEYSKADSIYTDILRVSDDYMPALFAMASLKRLENKPEESLVYCDKILNINHQNVYALSAKARTLLKLNKDKEALVLAKQTAQLSPDNDYNIATLAIVYHYNNMLNDRDKLVTMMTATKDSSRISTYQYALDVINNKEKFR